MNRAVGRTSPPVQWPIRRVVRLLWTAFWTPFWLGSTLPPPPLPVRRDGGSLPADRTPLLLHQLDDLRTTIWRQRRAVVLWRATWLALAALDLALLVRVVGQHAVSFRPFLLVALLVVALGGGLVALARPSRRQLARTLDRSFGLRERVATALEEAEGGRLTGVRALQVLEATQVTKKVSTASAFQARWPVREVVLATLTAILGLTLLIALFITRHQADGDAAANSTGKPSIVPGQQTLPDPRSGQQGQTGQNGAGANQGQPNPGQGGQPSTQGQRDLDTLAGALQDHSTTRQAADKLTNGDYAGAAQALRDAGQSASQLSSDTRKGLARDLRDVAGKVSDPQLAQDLREAANGLEQPGATGASKAFDQIANDVNRIAQGGQQPNGQNGATGNQANPQGSTSAPGAGSGGGAGTSPQLPGAQRSQPAAGAATLPLGTDGKPIELPKGNTTDAPITTQNPNSRGTGPSDPGTVAAGGGQLRQGDVGEAGIDPNQVPIDQRGTVQQYFTPPPQGKE